MPTAVKLYSEQDFEVLTRKGVLTGLTQRPTLAGGYYMDPSWNARALTIYLVDHLRTHTDVSTGDEFEQRAQSIYDIIKAILELPDLPLQAEPALREGRKLLHQAIATQLTISAVGPVQRSLNGDRPPRWLIRKKRFQVVANVSVYAITDSPDLIQIRDRLPAKEKANSALAKQQEAKRLLVRRVPALDAFEVALSDIEAQNVLNAARTLRADLTKGRTPEELDDFNRRVAEIRKSLDPEGSEDER